MKKSEQYHLAQIAVINCPAISPERKLEILSTLMQDESREEWCEKNGAAAADNTFLEEVWSGKR